MQKLLGLLTLLGLMVIYCTPVQASVQEGADFLSTASMATIQVAQLDLGDDIGEPPSEPPEDIEAPLPLEG